MPSILSLSHTQARKFFLEGNNYVNFDLPPYVTFDSILQKLSNAIGDNQISTFFRLPSAEENPNGRALNPKNYEGVDYKLVGNKDGKFAWRPFEIIHPALYVALVNDITSEESWTELLQVFHGFRDTVVICESIPYQSDNDDESHSAQQVKKWWTNVEQASIKQGMKYQYVFDADISDCYGSIYTHSISWALHGKENMKSPENRVSSDFIGNRIDWMIQKMRFGQTNGIPQGSTLMDFIAEIILGYVDLLLTERVKDLDNNDFSIIRYRDDYKVFTNNPELGNRLIKDLSEVLGSLGLKLNTQKTKMKSDPIIASIKEDKISELFIPRNDISMSKWLVRIYAAIDKYPNSGMVARQLDKYIKILDTIDELEDYDDPTVMISIVINIAIKNPRAYPWCMAILSRLIYFCEETQRTQIIENLINKFSSVPNTGLLDIWLQRVSYKIDPTINYEEMITKIVSGTYLTNLIWKSDWLKPEICTIVMNTSIVDKNKLDAMDPVITLDEVALFNPLILS